MTVTLLCDNKDNKDDMYGKNSVDDDDDNDNDDDDDDDDDDVCFE